jgi:hypothetical protein
MKLVVEANRSSDREREGGRRRDLHRHTDLASSVRFRLDCRDMFTMLRVRHSRGRYEFALDAVGEGSNALDGGLIHRRVRVRPFLTMTIEKLAVDEPVQGADLGGRVPGRARTYRPGVDHGHTHTGVREEARQCQPGDPGAHNRHVAPPVTIERRERRVRGVTYPWRLVDLDKASHSRSLRVPVVSRLRPTARTPAPGSPWRPIRWRRRRTPSSGTPFPPPLRRGARLPA